MPEEDPDASWSLWAWYSLLNGRPRRLTASTKQHFSQYLIKGQAVQYFYEPFLEQFDPDLRKQLGVWYTPPEIVQYMVGRLDAVLRQELGIDDGFADPRVYVDPSAILAHILSPCLTGLLTR